MKSNKPQRTNFNRKIDRLLTELDREEITQETRRELRSVLESCRQNIHGQQQDEHGRDELMDKYSERLKEMQCLYDIMDVLRDEEKPPEELMPEIVDLIPSGFHHPEKCEVRIEYNDQVYQTAGFENSTLQILTTDIRTTNQTIGSISVLNKNQSSSSEAFLPEEKQLILKISEIIQYYIEKNKVNQSLVQREEHYRSLFDNSPDPIFFLDKHGYIRDANEAMVESAECAKEELIGLHYEQLLEPSGIDRVRRIFEKVLKGAVKNYDVKGITAKGNHREISVTNIPVIAGDEVKGIHAIAKDITEIRQTENLLYKTYKLARMGTWELDVPNDKLYWSSITRELHEVDENYVPDLETAINFYKPGSKELVTNAVNEAIQKGKTFDLELEIVTAKGNERWIRAVGEAEFRNGECIRIYGSTQDIHHRKQAQQKSEQSRRLLEAILDNTESLVFVKDSQKRYQLVNNEFAKIFELPPEQMIGKTPQDLFDEKEAFHSDSEDQKILHTGEPMVDRNWVSTPYGERYYFSNKFPLTNVPGMENAIGGIVTDITSVKEAELRAQKQREAITYLATDKELARSSLESKLKTIARISAQTLNVDQVHIWLLEDGQLRCICSYDSGEYEKMVGDIVEIHKYPNYYKEIQNNRVIAIDDVYQDSRTDGLAESFMKSRDIRALLDNSIHMSGSPMGLVGHNVLHEPREWRQDEIMFAEAIADQVAQVFADEERQAQEAEIRESLKEKEILLAEIHHRVKNNLAVVSSMMQLQAYKAENPELTKKLMDSVLRIKVMANIHDHLYQSNSFAKIDFSDNLQSLVGSVIDTMQSETKIHTTFNCREVSLNVNQAIPTSLIVNEVITNSLKYAFPGREEGHVSVELGLRKKTVSLKIEDDGIGLPENFKKIKGNSMGIKIIEVLTEQLDADYEYITTPNGCMFTLEFQRTDIKDSKDLLDNSPNSP